MNGIQTRYRTLGELLTELKARLGFVAQGPGSSANHPILTSFLQEGHDFITSELGVQYAKKSAVITLEPGSTLYDWHNDAEDEDIDPGRVSSVWLVLGPNNRIELKQGITQGDRALIQRVYPTRYDTTNGQMEVWPTPEQNYDVIVDYVPNAPRFTQSSDRPGVNDRLILLYAIANGKAHYRHPDAQAAGTTFANMLKAEKGRQHENRRYVVNGGVSGEATVMGSDGRYFLPIR